jgi:hypothetical protein
VRLIDRNVEGFCAPFHVIILLLRPKDSGHDTTIYSVAMVMAVILVVASNRPCTWLSIKQVSIIKIVTSCDDILERCDVHNKARYFHFLKNMLTRTLDIISR